MKDWKEVRVRYSYWPHTMWQWATTDSKCVVCDIHGHETAQEFLVYVEGEGDKQYCKMCYFSKFVHKEQQPTDEELRNMGIDPETGEDLESTENTVISIDDLPPEVMTDGKGNTTLDNW